MTPKPDLAADAPSDWLCFVEFLSAVAAATRRKLKCECEQRSGLQGGHLEDPGGVSHKPQGVSHKPHLAADLPTDWL